MVKAGRIFSRSKRGSQDPFFFIQIVFPKITCAADLNAGFLAGLFYPNVA
jgi:hypothetical protein